MDTKILPELWIKIFQFLSPVELCFSVSIVCKKFYELSQDNQVWSQFKCDSWNDKTTFSVTKRKSFLAKTVSRAKNYKTLYINWIRDQGTRSRQTNSLPNWFKKDEKPNFALAAAGNIAMNRLGFSYQSALIANSADPLKVDDYLTNTYKDKKIAIREYNASDSRMPLSYYIDSMVKFAKGVFYVVSELQDYDKLNIEYIKKGLDTYSPFDSYLMVLDYTQYQSDYSSNSQTIQLDKPTKKWLDSLGVEFIESKDISSALDKMVKILDTKYHESYPKYLPSESEFENYVFKPKSDLDFVPPAQKSTTNNFFSTIKKLFSNK